MPHRQHSRTTHTLTLGGDLTVHRRLSIRDISLRGARVETSDPLPLHSVRDFRLHLDEQTIVLKGRVCHVSVRTRKDRVVVHSSGIEFLEVTPAVRTAIERFLERGDGVVEDAEDLA